MLNHHFHHLRFNRKRRWSKESESEQEYFFPDIPSSTLTPIKTKTNTQVLIGLQQKPSKLIDWLPVLSIILAIIICLIAFILLCKRQVDHRRYIYSEIKQRRHKRHRNNNQTATLPIDVAECLDDQTKFVAGLSILLARGDIILTEDDAQMLNSMNTFDRLRFFQELVNEVHP